MISTSRRPTSFAFDITSGPSTGGGPKLGLVTHPHIVNTQTTIHTTPTAAHNTTGRLAGRVRLVSPVAAVFSAVSLMAVLLVGIVNSDCSGWPGGHVRFMRGGVSGG